MKRKWMNWDGFLLLLILFRLLLNVMEVIIFFIIKVAFIWLNYMFFTSKKNYEKINFSTSSNWLKKSSLNFFLHGCNFSFLLCSTLSTSIHLCEWKIHQTPTLRNFSSLLSFLYFFLHKVFIEKSQLQRDKIYLSLIPLSYKYLFIHFSMCRLVNISLVSGNVLSRFYFSRKGENLFN